MAKNFTWKPDGVLPRIEAHTKRKLDVLKNYLDDYFDTVVPNPGQDKLNITLVDGFCGGGAYADGARTRAGSPLVMLDAVEEATVRLNEKREKSLEINARFFFVDNKPEHVAALRQQLQGRGYAADDPRITILEGTFVEHLPAIMRQINATQRAGRSIFFLDPFGYSEVPMSAIQTIFSLDRAEVVLNFAIDALLNYLQDASADRPLFRQFGIDARFIADWNHRKDESMGRAITQRTLMAHIHAHSGARFFTPFMLWSRTDNRWMMLAHLSQHQAARDKMLSVHWREQNRFIHIGPGGLFNLGYDARLIERCDSLFDFSERDRSKLHEELVNALPPEVHLMMNDGPLKVSRLLSEIGNRTAGTNSDICQALSELAQTGEFEVLTAEGKAKRARTMVSIKDRLILPRQRSFFFAKKKW